MKRNKQIWAGKTNLLMIIYVLVLATVATLMVVFFESFTNSKYGYLYKNFVKGDIAEEDVYVISSIDIIDPVKTEQAKEEARKAVLPVFSYNSVRTLSIFTNYDKLRTAVEHKDLEQAKNYIIPSVAEQLCDLEELEVLYVAYDLITDILSRGYYSVTDLQKVSEMGYRSITVINDYLDGNSLNHEKEMPIDGLITSLTIETLINDEIDELEYELEKSYLVKYLVASFCTPNINYDQYITVARQQQAYEERENVIVSLEKGTPIIRKDHVITQDNLDMLKFLSENSPVSFDSVVKDLVFFLLTLPELIYLVSYFNRKNMHSNGEMIVAVSGIILSCCAAVLEVFFFSEFGLSYELSLIPVAFVPILLVMLTGKKTVGYSVSLLISVIFCRLPGCDIFTFFFFLLLAVSGCLCVRFFNRRMDMILAWLVTLLVTALITVIYSWLENSGAQGLILLLIGIAFNISITYLLLSICVPVLEKSMNIPTVFRLHELAFSDSPALNRLSQVASGTYTHSEAVADLAALGAKAIGANEMLCRVGALYHDIGKADHPEYFVENQTGSNKHDDLNPSLSASIIKNHVKVGAQKGRDMGLPPEVIEIIECHHGNDVISYFYNEALKESRAKEEVSESDFTYDASIPSTRECGIVMLADSIEAASRTVTPNPQKYNKLIQSIFLKRVESEQLVNSGLTLGDLRTLRNTFVKALLAKNHSRIEYPDQEDD